MVAEPHVVLAGGGVPAHRVEPVGAGRLGGGAGADGVLVGAGELGGDRLPVGGVPVGRGGGPGRAGERFDCPLRR